ncbi:hypothetical protein [Halopelagius fulvigenes]|uniref:Uncharacterized protein n=1 Tax=Halopelagius fulvigenes TaxID=1198324 RepID=A0ABD5U3Y3_9EURY
MLEDSLRYPYADGAGLRRGDGVAALGPTVIGLAVVHLRARVGAVDGIPVRLIEKTLYRVVRTSA